MGWYEMIMCKRDRCGTMRHGEVHCGTVRRCEGRPKTESCHSSSQSFLYQILPFKLA